VNCHFGELLLRLIAASPVAVGYGKSLANDQKQLKNNHYTSENYQKGFCQDSPI